MELKNTRQLTNPESHRWKVLLVGRPGVGKTTWASTAPEVGIAACETGHGKGLLSVASQGVDFVEPASHTDFRSICNGTFEPFRFKSTIVLDSLTYMTKSFIKDHVLSTFPSRNQKEAMRRGAGVPIGFDYSDIADVTRTLLGQLINQPKHIIVTCLEKTEKDDNGLVTAVGPDLPGQLFLGAPAMFDTVLYLKVRAVLRDPKDPRSKFEQRYLITGNDGIHVAKDRNSSAFKSFLDPEEIFDPVNNRGTFSALLSKILAGHQTHCVPQTFPIVAQSQTVLGQSKS